MKNSQCDFPSNDTRIFIPGPAGPLEAIITGPEQAIIQQIGIVCHPHPLYEGTMNNKVVTTVARTFRELNCGVIRFNFRGVGNSAGIYDHTLGETDDLLAIRQWAENKCENYPIWLAGFSFGAYIAAKVAAQNPVAKLVLIAPPVNHFDFASLRITSPTWIVQGDKDEVVPAQEVYEWHEKFLPTAHLIRMPTATHFFHGHLKQLQSELTNVLR